MLNIYYFLQIKYIFEKYKNNICYYNTFKLHSDIYENYMNNV
jgi:hypothetical protein